MTPYTTQKTFQSFLFVIAVFGVLAYGLFEARRLLTGPQITIEAPRDGSATSTSAVVIEGRANNISFLTINDKPAFTNESGHFSVTLSPPVGYTVFTVAAIDRFGRRASKSISITILNYCTA